MKILRTLTCLLSISLLFIFNPLGAEGGGEKPIVSDENKTNCDNTSRVEVPYWATRFSGAINGAKIVADNKNNTYVAGTLYQRNIGFENGESLPFTAESKTWYVASHSSDGSFNWAAKSTNSGRLEITEVVGLRAYNGGVMIAGNQKVNLANGNTSNESGFITVISYAGQIVTSIAMPDRGKGKIFAISKVQNDGVYVCYNNRNGVKEVGYFNFSKQAWGAKFVLEPLATSDAMSEVELDVTSTGTVVLFSRIGKGFSGLKNAKTQQYGAENAPGLFMVAWDEQMNCISHGTFWGEGVEFSHPRLAASTGHYYLCFEYSSVESAPKIYLNGGDVIVGEKNRDNLLIMSFKGTTSIWAKTYTPAKGSVNLKNTGFAVSRDFIAIGGMTSSFEFADVSSSGRLTYQALLSAKNGKPIDAKVYGSSRGQVTFIGIALSVSRTYVYGRSPEDNGPAFPGEAPVKGNGQNYVWHGMGL